MQAGTIVGNLASAIGITTEDAALVADLKAGSESAFALLIAQYHQPLYSLISRSLNDPADAADITQEVFIKVFRSIRKFNGAASLRPRPPGRAPPPLRSRPPRPPRGLPHRRRPARDRRPLL